MGNEHPAIVHKVILNWIFSLIFAALNVIALVMAFPLQPRILIPTITLIFLSVYAIYPIFLNRFRQVKISLRYCVAAIFLCLALTWSLTAPFLAYSRPHYTYFSDQFDPTIASVQPLMFSGNNYGTVSYFADPFRRWPFEFASKFWPNSYLTIKELRLSSRNYVVLPLRSKFLHHEKGLIQDENKTSLFVPKYSTGVGVSVEPGALNFSPHFSTGSIVKTSYVSSKNRPPWNAIALSSVPTSNLIRYAAVLDISISLASTARTTEAFDILNQVTSSDLPAIEKARAFVLLGKMSSWILSGNLGGLQALALYNRAYDELMSTNPTPNFYKRSPAMNWIINNLRGQYALYEDVFRERIIQLRKIIDIDETQLMAKSTKVVDDLRKTFRQSQEETDEQYIARIFDYMRLEMLSDKGLDYFADLGNRIKNLDNMALKREIDRVYKSDTDKINLVILYSIDSLAALLPIANLPTILKSKGEMVKHMQIFSDRIAIIEKAIEKCRPYWRKSYITMIGHFKNHENMMNKLLKVAPESDNADFSAEEKENLYFEISGDFAANLGYDWAEEFLRLMAKSSENPELLRKSDMIAPVSARWWESKYIEFFMTNLLRYLSFASEIREGRSQLNEIIDVKNLEKDQGGEGVDFIPGMVIVASGAKWKHKDLRERLENKLDEYLQAPFGQLLDAREPSN